jgi:hypothetical protein
MHRRSCPGCREYAVGGIRCGACGHRFCTPACLEAHRQGYHGLPPSQPPLWFGVIISTAAAYVCLFALAVVVGILLISGDIPRPFQDAKQQHSAPQIPAGLTQR